MTSYAWDERCPGCGLNWHLFPPVRFNAPYRDALGNLHFKPGDEVRCIECKREYPLPETPVPASHREIDP